MIASKHLDALVIGAGLAGLNAALRLEARGLRVQLLEAQTRVGGRIHSMRQLGQHAEAGATYIGIGYKRLIATAERYGVELVDVTPLLEFFREQDLVLGTEIISQAAWPTHPANPFPQADKKLLPWMYHRVLTMRENPLASPAEWLDPRHAELDISVASWMRSMGLGDRVVALGYNINPSFGASAEDVSTLLLLLRAAFSRAQRPVSLDAPVGFTARQGVQAIPEAMAQALEHEIHFKRVVSSITVGARSVSVRCADGTAYEAEHAVCALPFGVLRHIAIDPPFAGAQAEAVERLRSQPVTQVYLAPKSAFWERDGHAASLFTDSPAGMVAAVRNGSDPREVTGITAWVMGRHAAELDALAPAEAGRRVITAIEALRPAARGELELIDLKSWGNDPYARGAWAYFRPGEVSRYAAAMGAAHGRLHFCGEHLAVAERGMEAAMESGERAAEEILARTTAGASASR
jgi:monoamine oxidase